MDLDRRRFLRGASLIGASAVGIPALAGCSSPSTDATFAPPFASPRPAARQGGRLTVGPMGDPGNFDPTTNLFDYPQMPLSCIFEGLTAYPAGQRGWTPQNLLATSLDQSSDGRRYRFTVKEGVQFHQGFGEMTAEDVKYSFERAAGLVPLYPGAGKSAVSYYSSDFSGLIGIEVTGRYSGEMHFKEPFVPLDTITLPFASSGWITSQKAIATYGAASAQKPVGTGPYEVSHYSPNSSMTLRRFEDYHGGNRALGAHNAFSEVQIVLTPSNARTTGQALTVPLESGEVDFTDGLGQLDVELLADDAAYTAYRPEAALNYFFLAMDVKHPALQDLRVREAVRYAIDVDEINLANRVTTRERLRMPVPRELEVGYWAGAPAYPRDLTRATELLKEAGAEDLSLTIATPNLSLTAGDPNAVMQVVQANLKDVGIHVSVVEVAPDSFVSQPGAGALLWGNYAGAPDPYYQLEWFTCDQIGVWNYASWCDRTYTHLLGTLGSTTDPADRHDVAVQMQKQMDDAASYVFTSSAVNYALSASDIHAVFDGNGNPQPHYFYRVAG
jgi:peptide/nickel transport system substrate-binding protein